MTKTAQKIFFILLGIILLSSFAPASLSKDEIYEIFSDANQDFVKANELSGDLEKARVLYEKAILGYKKLIDEGQIHNAKLYYNLANAYLLNEQLGLAILNYRRARELDNSDPDILKNLNYARRKRVDQIPVSTRKKVMQRLFFWHYDFSMKTRIFSSVIFFGIMFVWLTLRIWIKKFPAFNPVFLIFLILFVLLSTSVIIEQIEGNQQREGVIVLNSVRARQGDGANYPESFKEPLHEGTEFDLLEKRPNWYHIKLPNNSTTWIPDNSCELL